MPFLINWRMAGDWSQLSTRGMESDVRHSMLNYPVMFRAVESSILTSESSLTSIKNKNLYFNSFTLLHIVFLIVRNWLEFESRYLNNPRATDVRAGCWR